MQWLFALTLLLSATLLFLVQPMFAKMVLPRLGGTPAVWNTCMVFYQAVLLGGYLYAHWATRWLGSRRQAAVHLGLLILPWVVLPIGLGTAGNPPTDQNPIPWLLGLMTVCVGLPFFVVSTSAPMLQAWFADTGHPASRDPYFLYAASNLGSMVGLLGYPTLVEPYLSLAGQSFWWAMGYAALMVFVVACAAVLWRSPRAAAASVATLGPEPAGAAQGAAESAAPNAEPTPRFGQRLRWLALAFAPSSMLLGVTTYISTDIAAVPLLWVIPLALYLLSFVLVFARWTILPHGLMARLQLPLVLVLALVFFSTTATWMQWMVLLHLGAFFVTAMVCHGELARSRPPARHLTEFYIWLSVGGVLGGLFNALVAPVIFPTVIEYPLVVAIACMLRPVPPPARRPVLARWLDLLLPMLLLGFMRVMFDLDGHRSRLNEIPTLFGAERWQYTWDWLNWRAGLNYLLEWTRQHVFLWLNDVPVRFGKEPWNLIGPGPWHASTQGAVLGLGALGALAWHRRPVRFGTALGMVLLGNLLWFGNRELAIHTERSFFGVIRVREDAVQGTHTLVHGSTNHGEQWLDPDRRQQPITYYHRTGPLGEVFTKLTDPASTQEIGVVGLGTGTIAAWGEPGQRITYFEIDPTIIRIAFNPHLFTYVTDALERGVRVEVELGDARISLERQPDRKFDLLIVDAFSSDAIPVHLMTQQALELYFAKLKPDGILMVHISNRHLELAPVLGNIARGRWVCRWRNDTSVSDEEEEEGKFASDWVILVREEKRLGPLAHDKHWKPIAPDRRVGVWTDDYSNLLAVLRWFRTDNDSTEEP